jgi:hypothetical protein
MKVCNKCRIQKEEIEFAQDKTRKDGLRHTCKTCYSLYSKSYYKLNSTQILARHRERSSNIAVYNKNYTLQHRESRLKYFKELYLRNRIEKIKYSSFYRKNNRNKCNALLAEWRFENPGRLALHNMKQHSKRSLRIPQWITKRELFSIDKFYKECPDGYDVDHIIPLVGKTVSGFHILSNLQYLPHIENLKKGNKFACKV